MRPDKMTTKAQEAVRAAADLASRRGNPELYPEHLLRAIVEQEGGIGAPLLEKAGADPANVLRLLDARIDTFPRVSGGAEPNLARRTLTLLQKAEDEIKALKDDFISTEHIMLAAAKHDRDIQAVLEKAGLGPDKLLQALTAVRGNQRVTDRDPEVKFQALEKYTKDLTALARKRSWYLDVALFENPSLPLSTWQEMLSHPGMPTYATRYPHAPIPWLRAEAASPSRWMRAAVAAAPRLPEDTMALLARDAESEVRAQIARRADLPEALARALAADTDLRVRSQIAANPRTPAELLPAFAEECDVVRNGLLGNRLVPATLRERVCARNRDEWSVSEVKRSLEYLSRRE